MQILNSWCYKRLREKFVKVKEEVYKRRTRGKEGSKERKRKENKVVGKEE